MLRERHCVARPSVFEIVTYPEEKQTSLTFLTRDSSTN